MSEDKILPKDELDWQFTRLDSPYYIDEAKVKIRDHITALDKEIERLKALKMWPFPPIDESKVKNIWEDGDDLNG